MLRHFKPVNEKVKAGDFMFPGGFEVLKAEIEKVKTKYLLTWETEELGPKFIDVLREFQQTTVSPNFMVIGCIQIIRDTLGGGGRWYRKVPHMSHGEEGCKPKSHNF
jgi:hypothetical protein